MPTRREVVAGITATVALTVACGPSIIFEQESQKTPENSSRGHQLGDIFSYHGIPTLPRGRIGMRITDLAQYLINSKAKKYGREYWDDLPDYVLEDIIDSFPPQSVELRNYISEFSGKFKRKKPNGGEGLVFWGGAWTNRGYPLEQNYKVNRNNHPFARILNRLESSGWHSFDCDWFTYNAFPFNEYTWQDTLGPMGEIIKNGRRFCDLVRDRAPFEQQNHIAHSAGGIPAFEAVMQNVDSTNNLILIGVPIRGLRGTAGKVGEAIAKLGWKDNLVSYLASLPDDPEYQKRIDRLGEEFRRKGRKLTVIIHEDDPIATEENAKIKGADLIVIKRGIFGGIFNPLQGWQAHGAGLSDSLALEAIERIIGQNLAPIV